MFSASFDHKIKAWDLRNLNLLCNLHQHKSFIHALEFVPMYGLCSGSADKTVKLWSI